LQVTFVLLQYVACIWSGEIVPETHEV
jgi:hypothetical protein